MRTTDREHAASGRDRPEPETVRRRRMAQGDEFDEVDAAAVTTIRMLAADAVQAARSGHPGLPMGAAAPAWVLWSRFLRHDPADPDWPDRDRFVLSAGHGSMLLYALLHLFGYDLPRHELTRFRQKGARTPGHPERGLTPGVETTTGPLGQGLGNAVGMALAERMLAARLNTAGHTVVGHRTWVLAGDGDLMEGISHEAASLAGRLALGRLIVVYDDNDVTIDGPASLACRDDVLGRFAAYGWHTARVENGDDMAAVARALTEARAEAERPSLVAVRTTIGQGAPTLAGTSRAHGAPLGEAELAAARAALGWPDERFHVPDTVAARCRGLAAALRHDRHAWELRRSAWATAEPARAAAWHLPATSGPPEGAVARMPRFAPGATMATRRASGAVLAAIGPAFPALVGGSADLAASTNTTIPGTPDVGPGAYGGRRIHFGVREHAMGAVLNGMAAHGGLRPYGGTFLVFADYMRPAIRMAALMRLPVIFVFTHDSVAVGEDGPTHQPVEQLESLRLIPGLAVLRPADANETAACWRLALERTCGPTALVLSRQDLPVMGPVTGDAIARYGGRVVQEGGYAPDAAIVASGSEVALARVAAAMLADRGVAVRVISVAWRERFEETLAAARSSADPAEAATGESRGAAPRPGHAVAGAAAREPSQGVPEQPVFAGAPVPPDGLPAIWIEAGVPHGWRALARPGDAVLGLRRFGVSAPGDVVYRGMGFTVAAVVRAVLDRVPRAGDGRRDAADGRARTGNGRRPTGEADPPTGGADSRAGGERPGTGEGEETPCRTN